MSTTRSDELQGNSSLYFQAKSGSVSYGFYIFRDCSSPIMGHVDQLYLNPGSHQADLPQESNGSTQLYFYGGLSQDYPNYRFSNCKNPYGTQLDEIVVTCANVSTA